MPGFAPAPGLRPARPWLLAGAAGAPVAVARGVYVAANMARTAAAVIAAVYGAAGAAAIIESFPLLQKSIDKA